MFWSVKTQRQRILPIPSELKRLFKDLMSGRKEGFLFMNRAFAEGKEMPCNKFASRQSFMKVTKKIGCPELTRAHSLRHLFSTRVQEQGVNPFLVQGLLGHATLDMTRRYTHFDMDAKRQTISQMLQTDPSFRSTTEED